MKDVAVIRVHEMATSRLADQSARCCPTIEPTGEAPNRSGFRRVSVDDVWAFSKEQPEKLPDRERVFDRNLATHLAKVDRLDSHLLGEVGHVIFAGRNHARHEQSLAVIIVQARRQPNDVLGRPANIQPRNDSKNLHSVRSSLFFVFCSLYLSVGLVRGLPNPVTTSCMLI